MFHGHLMLHFSLSKSVWGCLNEPLLHGECGSPQTKGTLVTGRPLWGIKAIVTGTGAVWQAVHASVPHDIAKAQQKSHSGPCQL